MRNETGCRTGEHDAEHEPAHNISDDMAPRLFRSKMRGIRYQDLYCHCPKTGHDRCEEKGYRTMDRSGHDRRQHADEYE